MVSTPKIEKVKKTIERLIDDIERTKARLAELQAKLRENEDLKTSLENEEIVAMFRDEGISEAEYSAIVNEIRRRRAELKSEAEKADKAAETSVTAEPSENVDVESVPENVADQETETNEKSTNGQEADFIETENENS